MATDAANSSEWVMRRTAFRSAIDLSSRSRRASIDARSSPIVGSSSTSTENGPDDPTGYRRLLPHPSGELRGEEVGAFVQPERTKQLVAPLLEIVPVHAVGRSH